MPKSHQKAWAGRMEAPTDATVETFTTSFPFDRRLYSQDIRGSIAHCRMLAKQKIIPRRDAGVIVSALKEILAEFEQGRFHGTAADEDVHMAVERRLIEKVGAVGGKLHTARSRNDQVATDLRLFLREEIAAIRDLLTRTIAAFVDLAEQYSDVIMPGYTHLQPAQPVLFAHHLLAYTEMLGRDDSRLADCSERLNLLPLGSGALAGTTFPIDRAFVARELGFRGVTANSMDAVSDRDFAVEFLSAGALLGVHLSRFAEDLVLWSSQEFAFVELPDAFATGSSIMPQKKNPDVAELIRGKSGRLIGNLVSLLTVIKGLPMTYNRDLQEDKEPVFDTVDSLKGSLTVLGSMLPVLKLRRAKLDAAATAGFTLATELADYLSTRGLPFRQAHGVVGAVVRHCLDAGCGLDEVPLTELRRFSPLFEADVARWLTSKAAITRRAAPGGTAPTNVRRQLRRLKK